jgi:hypothetical protein
MISYDNLVVDMTDEDEISKVEILGALTREESTQPEEVQPASPGKPLRIGRKKSAELAKLDSSPFRPQSMKLSAKPLSPQLSSKGDDLSEAEETDNPTPPVRCCTIA